MANETLNIQNGVSPITIDTEVTEGSMRPVTSDGIYKAIQAGGGGGSSDVLNVTVKITGENGSETITYSHTADEVYDAYSAGKAIKMQIIRQPSTNAFVFEQFVHETLNGLLFTSISEGDYYEVPGQIFLEFATPKNWQYLSSSRNFAIVPTFTRSAVGARYVPMITSDDHVVFQPIEYSAQINGSLAQLVTGAILSAGTAIGATITDPSAIARMSAFIADLKGELDNHRPVNLFDEYMGFGIAFKLISVTINGTKITNLTGKTMLVENGNLENVSVCISCTYDADDEMTQAQIAAYCDSHAITFM